MARSRLFLDTSVVFAGIWSRRGGARELLLLGEARAVQLLVSKTVLTELERALASKAPELLGNMALLLDAANVEVVDEPPGKQIEQLARFTEHRGDAAVVAAARRAKADFLVSLDRRHLVKNRALERQVPFPIDTPGNCLAWVRTQLAELTRPQAY